jgi:hypothetical protein
LRVTRGEQGGHEGSASRACAPLLGAAGEVPPLAVVLSPSLSLELTETQVDVAAINGVQWGLYWSLQQPCCTSLSWRSNWTCRGPVTMRTCRAMIWKLSRPEPTGPRSPYCQIFPRRPPAALLTVLERSSGDSLGAFFLFFLCPGIYIYILFFSRGL